MRERRVVGWVVLAGLLGLGPRPGFAQTGLVHHWMADGTAGDAASGQVATMRNGTTFAAGQVGQAFSFDGIDDQVDAGDSANDYPSGSFTLTAWIRPTAVADATQARIIQKYECGGACTNASQSIFQMYLFGADAGQPITLRGFVRDQDGGGPNADGQLLVAPVPSITDGRFHHVAFVRDVPNAALTLYVDGNVAVTVRLNPAVAGPLGGDATVDGDVDPITIGFGFESFGTPNGHFTGRIDDVREYTSALTAGEVGTLVASGGLATTADAYTVTANTTLSVAAPGVLGNDGGGGLTAALAASPGHGAVTLNTNGSFAYTPALNFVGVDTFSYVASNGGGSSAPTTVTVTVANPTTAQAPALLEVVSVSGTQVTLRWDPPVLGPAPTGYVFEGGVVAGQPIVSFELPVDPTVYVFDAPIGSFFVRMRTRAGSELSPPSNEARLVVGTSVAVPSAPTNLSGLVVGSTLALSWKNTYEGGPPASVRLEVSGAFSTSLLLPLTESFAFPAVPSGSYTFTVRGVNAAGEGPASAPVTLLFPTACTGAPSAARHFGGYHRGRQLGLLWDHPGTGGAPTGYVVRVGGPISGDFPVGHLRRLDVPVPPGTYTFTVFATNACGSSPASSSQTVVIP